MKECSLGPVVPRTQGLIYRASLQAESLSSAKHHLARGEEGACLSVSLLIKLPEPHGVAPHPSGSTQSLSSPKPPALNTSTGLCFHPPSTPSLMTLGLKSCLDLRAKLYSDRSRHPNLFQPHTFYGSTQRNFSCSSHKGNNLNSYHNSSGSPGTLLLLITHRVLTSYSMICIINPKWNHQKPLSVKATGKEGARKKEILLK